MLPGDHAAQQCRGLRALPAKQKLPRSQGIAPQPAATEQLPWMRALNSKQRGGEIAVSVKWLGGGASEAAGSGGGHWAACQRLPVQLPALIMGWTDLNVCRRSVSEWGFGLERNQGRKATAGIPTDNGGESAQGGAERACRLTGLPVVSWH